MTKARRFYISVEVDFFDHPKTIAVGEKLAFRHLAAVAYCHKHRTDGYLSFGAGLSIVYSRPAASKLVAAGLWEVCDGGWRIHNYLEHQKSKAQLDAAADAGRLAVSQRTDRRG